MYNFYTNPQVIINADRIVLNSKKDDVMIFAKSNINLNLEGKNWSPRCKHRHAHRPYGCLNNPN
jgi:hypothetical protein